MLRGFIKGFLWAFTGLGMIFRPGIRRFVVIPLVINIALFAGGIYLLFANFSPWLEALMPGFPAWLSWLETGLYWLLWPLFAAMVLLLVFYSFTFMANVLAAPFNSVLAARVEAMLQGAPVSEVASLPAWRTVIRTLAAELGKWLYFLKWLLLLLLISLIPVINIVAPPLWMLWGVWMLALEYLDYPMGNHGHLFARVRQEAVLRRGVTLGFGAGVMLMTTIPLLNFLAMPAAVAGATVAWVKREA